MARILDVVNGAAHENALAAKRAIVEVAITAAAIGTVAALTTARDELITARESAQEAVTAEYLAWLPDELPQLDSLAAKLNKLITVATQKERPYDVGADLDGAKDIQTAFRAAITAATDAEPKVAVPQDALEALKTLDQAIVNHELGLSMTATEANLNNHADENDLEIAGGLDPAKEARDLLKTRIEAAERAGIVLADDSDQKKRLIHLNKAIASHELGLSMMATRANLRNHVDENDLRIAGNLLAAKAQRGLLETRITAAETAGIVLADDSTEKKRLAHLNKAIAKHELGLSMAVTRDSLNNPADENDFGIRGARDIAKTALNQLAARITAAETAGIVLADDSTEKKRLAHLNKAIANHELGLSMTDTDALFAADGDGFTRDHVTEHRADNAPLDLLRKAITESNQYLPANEDAVNDAEARVHAIEMKLATADLRLQVGEVVGEYDGVNLFAGEGAGDGGPAHVNRRLADDDIEAAKGRLAALEEARETAANLACDTDDADTRIKQLKEAIARTDLGLQMVSTNDCLADHDDNGSLDMAAVDASVVETAITDLGKKIEAYDRYLMEPAAPRLADNAPEKLRLVRLKRVLVNKQIEEKLDATGAAAGQLLTADNDDAVLQDPTPPATIADMIEKAETALTELKALEAEAQVVNSLADNHGQPDAVAEVDTDPLDLRIERLTKAIKRTTLTVEAGKANSLFKEELAGSGQYVLADNITIKEASAQLARLDVAILNATTNPLPIANADAALVAVTAARTNLTAAINATVAAQPLSFATAVPAFLREKPAEAQAKAETAVDALALKNDARIALIKERKAAKLESDAKDREKALQAVDDKQYKVFTEGRAARAKAKEAVENMQKVVDNSPVATPVERQNIRATEYRLFVEDSRVLAANIAVDVALETKRLGELVVQIKGQQAVIAEIAKIGEEIEKIDNEIIRVGASVPGVGADPVAFAAEKAAKEAALAAEKVAKVDALAAKKAAKPADQNKLRKLTQEAWQCKDQLQMHQKEGKNLVERMDEERKAVLEEVPAANSILDGALAVNGAARDELNGEVKKDEVDDNLKGFSTAWDAAHVSDPSSIALSPRQKAQEGWNAKERKVRAELEMCQLLQYSPAVIAGDPNLWDRYKAAMAVLYPAVEIDEKMKGQSKVDHVKGYVKNFFNNHVTVRSRLVSDIRDKYLYDWLEGKPSYRFKEDIPVEKQVKEIGVTRGQEIKDHGLTVVAIENEDKTVDFYVLVVTDLNTMPVMYKSQPLGAYIAAQVEECNKAPDPKKDPAYAKMVAALTSAASDPRYVGSNAEKDVAIAGGNLTDKDTRDELFAQSKDIRKDALKVADMDRSSMVINTPYSDFIRMCKAEALRNATGVTPNIKAAAIAVSDAYANDKIRGLAADITDALANHIIELDKQVLTKQKVSWNSHDYSATEEFNAKHNTKETIFHSDDVDITVRPLGEDRTHVEWKPTKDAKNVNAANLQGAFAALEMLQKSKIDWTGFYLGDYEGKALDFTHSKRDNLEAQVVIEAAEKRGILVVFDRHKKPNDKAPPFWETYKSLVKGNGARSDEAAKKYLELLFTLPAHKEQFISNMCSKTGAIYDGEAAIWHEGERYTKDELVKGYHVDARGNTIALTDAQVQAIIKAQAQKSTSEINEDKLYITGEKTLGKGGSSSWFSPTI